MSPGVIWVVATLVAVLVIVLIVVAVQHVPRGPTVSVHEIQLGTPFRFVVVPSNAGRHALWLESEVNYAGTEYDHYRLDVWISYDGLPATYSRVPDADGHLISQHGRAWHKLTGRISLLEPRPAGVTISIEGVINPTENVESAKLSLHFTRA
jgi:hypothetical protein